MLKRIGLIGLIATGVGATGCASYVKVYDGNGQMLGSCTTGTYLFGVPFFPVGLGSCASGSSNPKDQTGR